MLTSLIGIIASSGGAAGGAGAYESIATVIPSGSSNTVTFSSIPSTYASLQIRVNARGTANGGTDPLIFRVRVNGDTGNNYAYHYLQGDGSAASAAGAASASSAFIGQYADSGYAANIFGTMILDVHNYASTTQNKTFRSFSGVDRNNTTGGTVWLASGLWVNTSAITSISILNNGGDNFSSSSSFALYGIKGA